jgi:hypothetical protein
LLNVTAAVNRDDTHLRVTKPNPIIRILKRIIRGLSDSPIPPIPCQTGSCP